MGGNVNNVKNLLVVSENPDLMNELRQLLLESRFRISCTNLKGTQLIEMLEANTPDLAILDTPEISDGEVKQLIGIRRLLDFPIISLNSRKIQQNVVEVFRFGETRFEQTLPLDTLIDRIEDILGTDLGSDDKNKLEGTRR
jgi:DNA-binding response OmpR family regulator